jgi:hypothetical protein
MQIDASDEQPAKALFPINESREPDSNITSESFMQTQKDLAPISSTEEGIERDESEWQSTG